MTPNARPDGYTSRMKQAAKATAFDLKVEFDRETDGRWIADIPALPGVMVYGRTREQALAAVEALALRVIADRQEQGEAVFCQRKSARIAAVIHC